jgi:GntR family transcriptional regulator
MRHLDPSSGLPLYLQVADVLREQIGSGELLEGDAVPSLRVTAAELRVNVHTVGKAYQLLEREGVLLRRRGEPYRVGPSAHVAVQLIQEDIRALLDRADSLNLDPNEVLRLLEQALQGRQTKSA